MYDSVSGFRLNGEPVTIYAVSILYVSPHVKNLINTVHSIPFYGIHPLTKDEVETIGRRTDREEWDEAKCGPFKDARFVSCGIGAMASVPEGNCVVD